MANKHELDLTEGAILPKLIRFALPLIGTNILQVLFNVADVSVLGILVGDEAVAAVGSTGSLVGLIINLFVGLSTGANVVLARLVGERDRDRARRTVGTSISVSVILGVILAAVGYFGAYTFLRWMSCDPEVIDLATTYLKIYFLGMPIILLYNFAASILRAVGDTFHPLVFLLIGGVANVGLNIFFIAVCHLDVEGVAIATVVSQLISAVLCLIVMFRSDGYAALRPSFLRIDLRELWAISRIGIPSGVQGTVFAISNVIAQSSINSLGKIAMAGNSVANQFDNIIYNAMYAVALTAMAFVSQNLGAGKIDRLKKSVVVCAVSSAAVGLALGGIITIFGRPLASIMSDSEEVISFAVTKFYIVALSYFLCGIMDTYGCAVRGLGRSTLSMVNSLIGSCAFRVLWFATVFPFWHPANGVSVHLIYPLSWALTILLHAIAYRRELKKLSMRLGAPEKNPIPSQS